ncbi:MAG TPA: DUF4405 domain-containing protein [Candidatus Hypogeohydataceae bacterium YC41]
MGISGLIMWLVIPCQEDGRGFRGGRAILEGAKPESFLGLEHNTWRLLHEWAGVVLLCLLTLHLILHWGWIVQMTRRMLKGDRRT